MSLSGLVGQSYVSAVAAFKAVVEDYKIKWNSANTLEDQLAIEGEAIEQFYRVLDTTPVPDEVTEFSHLDIADIDEVYKLYKGLQKTNSVRIARLAELFLLRSNNQKILLNDLIGQVRRIKQKHAVLNLWNNEKTRFVVGNKFLDSESIDTSFTSLDACEINPTQGLLTLPVQLREAVDVANIKIAANSNGLPGNSDPEITTSNQDIKALISKNSNWFEYERLDSGPCKLTLVLELSRAQIVNHLVIAPADIGVPVSFEVQNIVFTTSGNESVSIHSLLPTKSNDLFLIDGSLNEDWELSFLPVEATSVAITFVQTQAYSIEVSSPDKRRVARDRYAIALRSITLQRHQYRAEGGINSVSTPIKKNLYAVEPVIRVNPNNSRFFSFVLEVSFDDGVTWLEVGTTSEPTVSLISQNEGHFLWRLSLTRNSDAFTAFSSFFEQEDDIQGEIKSTLKTVSRYNSPAVIGLNSIPKNEVHVIQPKIGRRGDKQKAFRLGSAGRQTKKLRLPVNVLKTKIKPSETKLYIGGIEYSRKEPGTALSDLEWSFTDDHNEVILSSDVPGGSAVDVVFDDEMMLLEEREDGYFYALKLPFDPDKDNIQVTSLSKTPGRKSVMLPRGETVMYLGVQNLIEGTFELVSTGGTVYTEVTLRDDVYIGTDNYFVDYENGILYITTAVGDDSVRASFDYLVQINLGPSQFDVVYSGPHPQGIRIAKNALDASTISETLSDNLLSVYNPLTKAYAARTTIIPIGSTSRRQLSHDYLIKGSFQAPADLFSSGFLPREVDFIDGVTEFLGLKEVTDEKTIAIAAGADGVVEFALSARALWYRGMDVVFSDTTTFATKVSSAAAVAVGANGSYYIADDGTVSVKVGVGNSLASDIVLSYYFKNPKFQSANKYSVDYENGILYAHALLNQSAVIQYKTASYRVSYDIAGILPAQYLVDGNLVEVRTENLDPLNNLVKIIWQEEKQGLVSSAIESYFSPLISLVGFRFS